MPAPRSMIQYRGRFAVPFAQRIGDPANVVKVAVNVQGTLGSKDIADDGDFVSARCASSQHCANGEAENLIYSHFDSFPVSSGSTATSIWHLGSSSPHRVCVLQLRCLGATWFLFADRIFWKTCPEHRSFARRLFFGRFILNNVPVLDKDPLLDTHNICGNPIHSSTEIAKSSVHDHEVTLSHDRSWFVFQGGGQALDKIE